MATKAKKAAKTKEAAKTKKAAKTKPSKATEKAPNAGSTKTAKKATNTGTSSRKSLKGTTKPKQAEGESQDAGLQTQEGMPVTDPTWGDLAASPVGDDQSLAEQIVATSDGPPPPAPPTELEHLEQQPSVRASQQRLTGERKRHGNPSVMDFLSKLSRPRTDENAKKSPVRGLLGNITRADLVAAGRLQDFENPPPPEQEDIPVVAQGEPLPFDDVKSDRIVVQIEPSNPRASHPKAKIQKDSQDAPKKGNAGPHKAAKITERTAREPLNHPIEIRGVFSGGGAVRQETVRNASTGGIFVETTDLLAVGEPVVLRFAASDGTSLSLAGRVRWVSPFGSLADARPGMGIEFVGLDDVKRRRLNEMLLVDSKT